MGSLGDCTISRSVIKSLVDVHAYCNERLNQNLFNFYQCLGTVIYPVVKHRVMKAVVPLLWTNPGYRSLMGKRSWREVNINRMIWRCVICFVFVGLTLRCLLSHINSAHSRSPDFRVVCGIDGCVKEYHVYNSLWYHIRRTHAEHLDNGIRTRSRRTLAPRR